MFFRYLLAVIGLSIVLSPDLYADTRAIVVGASSGIGAALVKKLSNKGYEVGLAARRVDKMNALAATLKHKSWVKKIDISDTGSARKNFKDLLNEMENVELIIINSGVGNEDFGIDWNLQKPMIEVNILGFAALVELSLNYFKEQKKGHLVGVTSVLGLRGMPGGAVYSGTKAFQQKCLEGFRATLSFQGLDDITITDIRPGYVDTDMIKNKERAFWMIEPEQAADDIYSAIQSKKKVAYVSRRWWLAALAMKFLPDFVFTWFLSDQVTS